MNLEFFWNSIENYLCVFQFTVSIKKIKPGQYEYISTLSTTFNSSNYKSEYPDIENWY